MNLGKDFLVSIMLRETDCKRMLFCGRTKRKIIVLVIVILLFAGIIVCWIRAVDQELRDVNCVRDQFFDALIHKKFDELDQVLAEDAWFAAQGKSYNELRDEIRENFETVEYIARKGEMSSETHYQYIPGQRTVVNFHIKIAEDCNGEKQSLHGEFVIKRMDDGDFKIIYVFCSSGGADGKYEFGESLFGPES